MVVKMDLEKAYDRFNLKFLKDPLENLDFNNHFVSLIMYCVSTCEMRVV